MNSLDRKLFRDLWHARGQVIAIAVVADFVDAKIPLGDRYRVETRTVVLSGEDILVIPPSKSKLESKLKYYDNGFVSV